MLMRQHPGDALDHPLSFRTRANSVAEIGLHQFVLFRKTVEQRDAAGRHYGAQSVLKRRWPREPARRIVEPLLLLLRLREHAFEPRDIRLAEGFDHTPDLLLNCAHLRD